MSEWDRRRRKGGKKGATPSADRMMAYILVLLTSSSGSVAVGQGRQGGLLARGEQLGAIGYCRPAGRLTDQTESKLSMGKYNA